MPATKEIIARKQLLTEARANKSLVSSFFVFVALNDLKYFKFEWNVLMTSNSLFGFVQH